MHPFPVPSPHRGRKRQRSPEPAAQPTPALSLASSSLSSPTPSTPLHNLHDERLGYYDPAASDYPRTGESSSAAIQSQDYLSRVSNIPIVNTALRAYEHGKNSSRVVKYGAEMVESSVSAISRPVIDRLGYSRRSSSRSSASRESDRDMSVERGGDATVDPVRRSWGDHQDGGLGLHMRPDTTRADTDSMASQSPRSPASPPAPTAAQTASTEVAQRSLWHTVLLEAGGIGTAVTVSDENLRRLRYALQWLQYATTHIDAQILVLRDFIASLQTPGAAPNDMISPEYMRKLNTVKRDLVTTIRQAVDVMSKYGGGALPEPARTRVRGFILKLPQRWARAMGSSGGGPRATARHGAHLYAHEVGGPTSPSRSHGFATPYSRATSPASTAPSSPIISPISHSRRGSAQDLQALPGLEQMTAGAGPSRVPGAIRDPREAEGEIPASQATAAAQKILTLATESLDMMRGVTGVVKESLERADTWVERLRAVGIQRGQAPGEEGERVGVGGGEGTRLAPLHYPAEGEGRGDLPSLRDVESLSGLSIRSAGTTPRMLDVGLPPLGEGRERGRSMDVDDAGR